MPLNVDLPCTLDTPINTMVIFTVFAASKTRFFTAFFAKDGILEEVSTCMKLPIPDELIEIQGQQLQCLTLIVELQQQHQKRLENLIVGATSIGLVLGVIITIAVLLN